MVTASPQNNNIVDWAVFDNLIHVNVLTEASRVGEYQLYATCIKEAWG